MSIPLGLYPPIRRLHVRIARELPSVMQTLFDGGRRRAGTDEAKASYNAAAAYYRETVLTGFQQVEDNLAALRILEQEAGVQTWLYRPRNDRSTFQPFDTKVG
jgi:hypothetical protein